MALKRHITAHPYLAYNALVLPLSYVALSSTPSLPSVSLLQGVLILQSTAILNRSPWQIAPLIFNLALGSTLATLSASTTALSSPVSSFVVSLVRGALFSIFALIPLGIRRMITRQASTSWSPWFKIAAFPALWAGTWMLVTSASPVGRLGSWTPLLGDEGYRWMRPYMGLAGVDFVVAGWAEVIAGLGGMWLQGSADEEVEESHHNGQAPHEQQSLIDHQHNGVEEYGAIQQQRTWRPRSYALLILAGLLFSLGIPSYHVSLLPLPVYSESTTPVSVACVLPPHRSPDSPKTPLDLYIAETRAVAPRAKIVLWPEGAVSFRTSTERKHAIELVKNTTQGNKVWIGMSFEEPANNGSDDKDGGHRAKLPFPSLPHHPDLILAPARTWHPSIGLAMASLAAARGDELGASVLWCDGGSGAVNGVYGYGRGNGGLLVEEVGNGGKSWVASFGVPYNGGKDEERPKTLYAWGGNYAALGLLAVILGAGWAAEGAFEKLIAGGALEEGGEGDGFQLEHVRIGSLIYPVVGRVIGYFRGQRQPERRSEVPVSSLI
ncbi:hypothetical protein FRC04_004884 [Tulasnella sp. 424]|nr:hypothetical protein FRC04_004884 [Tulasnella sp. 424]